MEDLLSDCCIRLHQFELRVPNKLAAECIFVCVCVLPLAYKHNVPFKICIFHEMSNTICKRPAVMWSVVCVRVWYKKKQVYCVTWIIPAEYTYFHSR